MPQQGAVATPIVVEQKPALLLQGGQIVQIFTEGAPIVLNQRVFDKTETISWEQSSS